MAKSKTGPGQISQASLRITAKLQDLKEKIANSTDPVEIVNCLQQLTTYEAASAQLEKIDDEIFGLEQGE